MQDHYLVAQAQDGGGYSCSCLKKGWDINVIMKYIFYFFFGFSGLHQTRAEKTQTLGVL